MTYRLLIADKPSELYNLQITYSSINPVNYMTYKLLIADKPGELYDLEINYS